MQMAQARGRAVAALIILFLAAAVLTASPLSAAGQTAVPVIENADLRLWPEYDDPGLLVIFSGQFAESMTFPLQVAFPVPAGARNIQATYQDDAGSLISRPFEVTNGALTYELPSRGFHVEFYVDRAPSAEQRDITYGFQAPYAINALRVAVQQPARATGFALEPAAENLETAADGLTYHVFNRRNLAAGETLEIDIQYTKADTALSAQQLVVAPTSVAAQSDTVPTTTGFAVAADPLALLPWLLIGLGLALGAGVLVYWWVVLHPRARATDAPSNTGVQTRLASPRPERSPASRPVASAGAPAARPTYTEEVVNFCTNCGHALKPEDRFCSQCGSPRRS